MRSVIRATILSLLLTAPLAAQDAALGGRQQEVLESVMGTALAPSELPAGWQPSRAEVAVLASGAIEYRIVYRDPDGACFEIVGGPPEGFGGPVPPNERGVVIDALPPGEGVRVYWTTAPDPGGAFPEPVVFSDWIPWGDLAHRFSSPASPVGACPAVDPETGIEIVASLVPIGGPATTESTALEEGEWQWLSYNDPTIERRAGESPKHTALRLLEELGMGLSPEDRAGELAVEQTVEVDERPDGSAAVRVTREGGGDDSVAGVRYLVLLEEIDDGLLEFRIGRAFRCHERRGHQGWSPEFCL